MDVEALYVDGYTYGIQMRRVIIEVMVGSNGGRSTPRDPALYKAFTRHWLLLLPQFRCCA